MIILFAILYALGSVIMYYTGITGFMPVYLTSTEQQAFLEKAGLAKAGSTTQVPQNRANR